MDISKPNLLNEEWQTLHQDYERYDRYSLLIKLAAILSSLIVIGLTIHLWVALIFILVLWLQEGIWRTVQARTAERLLALEAFIKRDEQKTAMQFYSDWEASRHGTSGLIKEYMRNALRPTVAYPYIILLGILVTIYQQCPVKELHGTSVHVENLFHLPPAAPVPILSFHSEF